MDKEQKIEQLKKILIKASSLEQGKEITLAKEFISIDEKIDKVATNLDTKLSDISEGLKKKLDEELSYEVDEQKIVESVLSKVVIPEPIKGDDGKDYILTEKDKKDIAKTIKVPVVEKETIIEKTEVIRETPIITNEIKEVAIPETPEDIKSKLETLKDEDRLDASAIKNLPEVISKGGSTARNTWQLNDVSKTRPTNGQTLIFDSSTGQYIPTIATDTDEKVKYNASDASAGYLADKVVAGTGITLSEGTGGDVDKLLITNTLDLTNYFNKVSDDTDDITDTATNRFTDDTAIARLANTSGTNTGDQSLAGYLQNNIGIAGGTTLIGGTGVTDTLTIKPTSGVGTTGADIIFKVGNNGATEAMRILNSGAVCIGTTAQTSALEKLIVKNSLTTGSFLMSFFNGSNSGAFFANSGSSVGWNYGQPINTTIIASDYVGGGSYGGLSLATGGTGRLLIDTSGNIGINTTSPSGKLHLRGAGATKATTALYVDNSTPAQILKLNNDGSMAIGLSTTLTGANALAFGQSSQATGDTSFALGYNQRATATGALCMGANAGSGYSEASGPWSVIAGGLLHKATGRYSTIVGGLYGSTTMYSQITFGHDRLVSGTGSFQTSIIPLASSITGTAQTELFIPSLASGQAIIPVLNWEGNPFYTMWNATITVNAFTASVGNGTGTQNHVFGGEYRCIVRRAFGSTTVTMVGSGVQTIYEDADTTMADAIVTIDGDSSTGALRVRFTPPTTAGSTTNTRVACSINYLQTYRE